MKQTILRRIFFNSMLLGCCYFLPAITIAAEHSNLPSSTNVTLRPQDFAALFNKTNTTVSSDNPVQEVIILGDPTKPGLYSFVRKIAPNTKLEPHHHPDERVDMIVAGDFYFGYGNTFNKSKLQKLIPGSLFNEKHDQNHFAMTNGEVIMVVTGYGPTSTSYERTAKR